MPLTIAALKAAWGSALLLYTEVKPIKEWGALTLCTASFETIVLQRQSFWVNDRTGLLQKAMRNASASPTEQGIEPLWTITTYYLPKESMRAVISLTHILLQLFFPLVSSDLIWNACYFSYKASSLYTLLSKLSDVASDHRKWSVDYPVRRTKYKGAHCFILVHR